MTDTPLNFPDYLRRTERLLNLAFTRHFK